jgi:hypothetical protein
MNSHTLKIMASSLTLCAALGGAISGQAQPTTTATPPTLPQGHVICIYNSSGVYTNIAGVNDFENWGGWNYAADYSVPPNVLSYYGLSYGGIGFEQNPQDVAGCTNLHVDLWTPDADCFAIRLVDSTGASADHIYTSASGTITDNNWLGLNMPMSDFPGINLASIQQIGLIANDAGEDPGEDYFLDNIYFSASTNIIPPPPIPTPTVNAPIPTNHPVLAMYDSSGVYPEVPVDDWDASWSSAVESLFTIPSGTNVVLKYNALQYAGVEFYNPDGVDVTNYNTMHVDIWTPNANQFGVQLVSLDNSGTQSAQVNITPASGKITTNTWIGIDIPLQSFTAINSTLDLSDLQQLLWIDNQGGGTVGGIFYIDNVYFYNSAVAPPPLPTPTTPAPMPTQPAGNVLAMYDSSGVYPEVPVDDWCASWSGASEASYTISNSSSTVLRYGGMSFAGAEFYSPDNINVSGYNTMHVDLWTPNANEFGIQLVSLNPTLAGQVNYYPATGTIASNRWVSLDIPLSQFTAPGNQIDGTPVDLTDLQQLLWIDNQPGGLIDGIFYIDNVYFYTSTVPSSPRISVTTSGGKVFISFATQSGSAYAVQFATTLTNPVWQTLTTVTGNGSTQTVTDSLGTPTHFYRVVGQ